MMRPTQLEPNTATATLDNIVSSNTSPDQKWEMLKQLFEVAPPTSQMLSEFDYDIDALVDKLLQQLSTTSIEGDLTGGAY